MQEIIGVMQTTANEKLKEVTSAEVLEKPNGIEVIGMNPEGYLFRGTIVEILTRTESYVVALRVEGFVFDGLINVLIDERIMLRRLKHFNQDVYDRLYLLMKSHANVIEQVDYYQRKIDSYEEKIDSYKKEFEAILSYRYKRSRLFRSLEPGKTSFTIKD